MAEAIAEVVRRLTTTASPALWQQAPAGRIVRAGEIKRAYSTVYRLRVEDTGGRTLRILYAKVYKLAPKHRDNPAKPQARLRTEFEAAQRLHARLNDSPNYGVVRPLAYYPDLLAIVTEEAQGRPIASLLEAACKRWHKRDKLTAVLSACRLAGEALAAIQRVTVEPQPYQPAELLDYVDLRLQRLVAGEAPFGEKQRDMVRRYLETMMARVPATQLGQCGCHGDYAPFNVLAAPAGVTVMDFAMFKPGSLFNDVTYFYHRLQGYLHKPIFAAPAIAAVQQAFLAGYNHGAGREHQPVEQDLLFRIFWIKHVINNYSAIMRKKVMTLRDRLSPAVYLFNRHVFRCYNQWLSQMCQP
ncbi:MAG: aminoglycoside phosphotransferase family protein [candidate division KSB1 bacterium]|nr:aminoglycoside phosphotransferase family protein [candidate division KSB1 bacterium]MDZ7284198.1 aminoglycoside phosphotransferase family protein [candidate division KSB1 bacterium]MDZ7297404.1 aminoglycoside phosphotransferase family protein [candidate division KSB1 bacterium]MDZ7306536.1 aminoglycoside phosphotransferase family protein [candidate division KSB1 bacterium]MDZ7348271.1 aminoglycoside phosphotransferase family protein [candidate division KSB1 bacterium]